MLRIDVLLLQPDVHDQLVPGSVITLTQVKVVQTIMHSRSRVALYVASSGYSQVIYRKQVNQFSFFLT